MIARNWLSLVQKNYHYSEKCAIIPLTYVRVFQLALGWSRTAIRGQFFFILFS